VRKGGKRGSWSKGKAKKRRLKIKPNTMARKEAAPA
jgi:hypothetical protein